MNRSPDELIDAMAAAATADAGKITVLMGDNEIARLVLAWRSFKERASHLVDDARTALRIHDGVEKLKTERGASKHYAAVLYAIANECPDMPVEKRAALADAISLCQLERGLVDRDW